MMNVSGWQDEPAPSPSPLTARLLRWLSDATPAPQEPSDEVAARLCHAMCELCDARSVALWLDLAGSGTLHLSHRAGEFESEETSSAQVEFLAEDFPAELFFTVEGEGGTRDLATKLGLLSEETAAPSLVVPIDHVGIALFWLESEDGRLSDDWKPVFEMAALQSATFLNLAARAESLNRAFRQFAQVVAGSIDGREAGREGFSEAVAYYAGLTARKMKLDEEESQKIEFAALLHGVGRLAVPEALLQKQSSLSEAELESVRAASAIGANWMASIDGLEEVALLVRHQGEKFDGSGVPAGMRGEEIPLGSRIMAVAARFAAMTARRADRAPMSVVGGAMDSVAKESGEALDPRVVDAFLSAMGRSVS
ncbi:HD domain-containing protein [Abditibacterium utsteinense]|uniref:HD domain-containing protein n=1 Tax=Abditibacterium utsteinense TaxID=1960156 RepID=A0A2S8ST88_9BACT|nr:HD domain-containing phosphohydrolase [Abditibacterium utsteinense]PQV63996.1 HD domain-containing protein [Abditibacterium utsteinense]